MRFISISLFILSFPFSQPAFSQQSDVLSQAQMRELIRDTADRYVENVKRRHDYTYVEREEDRKLDGNGHIKSTESQTYEVMVLCEEPVQKLIAKNDKALPAKDAQKEDEKVEKFLSKCRNESENDRNKRLKESEKDIEEARKFVSDIADAFDFRFVQLESREGRDTYIIDAEPRPGYKLPRDEKFLASVRFRVWVDKAERQWVKADIQCIDTISVGLFLVRLYKGSNIQVERTRVNDEVWLPKHIALKLDGRIALLKGLTMEQENTYGDYKKFKADATIVFPADSPQ
jgi:hypothetical protein